MIESVAECFGTPSDLVVIGVLTDSETRGLSRSDSQSSTRLGHVKRFENDLEGKFEIIANLLILPF